MWRRIDCQDLPRLSRKGVDFVPYQLVWLKFIVLEHKLVQKRWCFMLVWIPAISDPFQLYQDIYQISTGNWINFWETRGLRRSRGRRRGFCETRFNTVVVATEHQSLICCYFCFFFFFFLVLLSPQICLLIFLFHPHMNILWKFIMRWEVKGLVFIFTLYPNMVI